MLKTMHKCMERLHSSRWSHYQPAGATAASNTTNANAVAADAFAPALPVGGFSDVEAALFSPTIGGGDVSARGVESDANVGQVFGVAVSIPLYRALQAAQGLSDVNATTFDPVNAPNHHQNTIRDDCCSRWCC